MTEPETKPRDYDSKEGFHLDIHPWVFFISAGLIILFVASTIIFQSYLGDIFETLQGIMSQYVGWFFIWTIIIVFVFILILLFSKFGDVRIGGPDAKPEF